MKQGLSQWSTTLAKGMGVSALAIAMAGCVGTPGTSSSSEQQQTQSSAPVITSSANNTTSSAPVVTSSSMATASSAPNFADEDVAIVNPANYDGIPLIGAKGTPGTALQTSGNPFKDAYFYLSPDIKTMMEDSLALVGNTGAMADKVKYIQHQPSAIWMDSTATIAGNLEAGRRSLIQHLDAAVAQQNF